MIYYPALITGAFFLSLLILDLIRRDSRPFVGHLIFGIIAVILMVYLSQNDAEFVAWGIFSIPVVLLCIGLLIGYFNVNTTPGPTVAAKPDVAARPSCIPFCTPSCPHSQAPNPPSNVKEITTHDTSGNSVTTAPPAITACGPNSGKTQCIDTRSLKSA